MSQSPLSARAKARRLELGLALGQVAEVSGLSIPYISTIEQGRANPTVSALQALAGALGWSVVEFFKECPSSERLDATDSQLRGEPERALPDRLDEGCLAGSLQEPCLGVPGSAVGEWLRIDRTDLLDWVESGEASLRLPELIRRLVQETTPANTQVDFPAGKGALSGGWDGLVLCDGDHPFVPKGRSGWELSTGKNSNRKARHDYEKRCQISREARTKLSYVAVICRPWIDAREFAESKSLAGDFREVRAYTVDHLETWLASAPETTLWLRDVIGKPVDGVKSLRELWDLWLESTKVPLDAEVVLAGRDASMKRLRRKCEAGGVVTVGWDAPHEEILVILAAALVNSDAGREVLYVDDVDSAKRLLARPARRHPPSALTVVVPSLAVAKHLAPRAPQCVVVPVPRVGEASIQVGPVDSVKIAERFTSLDVEHHDPWQLGHLGRRSLLALRRRLARQPDIYQPDWSKQIDATIRRCLLLNRWDRSSTGDVAAVERLVGKSYPEVEERLESLTRCEGSDPPLMRTGSVWHVVCPEDAWILAGHSLRDEDLKDMAELAVEVLGEPDPLGDLTGAERLLAQMRGESPLRSQRFKEGLAASLAVLGTVGNHVPGRAPYIVSEAVTELLSAANADPTLHTWTSVAPFLPILAEAAPDAVLDALRTGLARNECALAAFFSEEELDEYGFPRDVPKRHFIFALDVLSWSPQFLAPAVDLLAILDELGDRSGLSHRPASVLSDILCPWMPNTSASKDQRLAVLDAIRDRHPEVAWEVMIMMLSSRHRSKPDGYTPRYRDWKDHRKVVPRGEHYEMVAKVGTLLVADAAAQPQRYAELIPLCGEMPPSTRAELLRALRCVSGKSKEVTRQAISSSLRATFARHREFSDANRALPPNEIAEFESLLETLGSGTFLGSHGWLFDYYVSLPDGVLGPHKDAEEDEVALSRRRADAVAEIFDAGGVESVIELAASVKAPSLVGRALASIASRSTDAFMLTVDVGEPPRELRISLLDDRCRLLSDAVRGYFVDRFRSDGWDLFDALLADGDVTAVAKAELLRASLDPRPAWERLEALDPDVGREYWARITRTDLGRNDDMLIEAARRMAASGRVDASANLLARSIYRLEADLEFAEASADMLEQLLEQEDGPDAILTYQSLTSLLKVLHHHASVLGEQRVARIEWAFLPALGFGTKTPCLHRFLAEDPDFFVEIAQLAYIDERVDKETRDSSTDDWDPMRSSIACDLLRKWPRSPGLDDEGDLDPDRLRDWVTRARARLAEIGRTREGDIAIGTALAASPAGPDRQWPAPAVCDVIEEAASDELEFGFSTAVFKSRGLISGSIWEGGEQERELADKYLQIRNRLETKWHRTAAIFRQLASDEEQSALARDQEAEARHRGI